MGVVERMSEVSNTAKVTSTAVGVLCVYALIFIVNLGKVKWLCFVVL